MSAKKAKANTKKKKRRKSATSSSFFSYEKLRKVIGLSMILFSVILLIAMISYFPTWKQDQVIWGSSDASNWIGQTGRSLSIFFVQNLFGIASMLFVLVFFNLGYPLLYKRKLLPLIRTSFFTLFFMLWISVLAGYLSHYEILHNIFAGAIGYESSKWLIYNLGSVGTIILLFFILTSFLIITFNISLKIKLPKIPKSITSSTRSTEKKQQNDLYNTAEYAVDEEEDSSATDFETIIEDHPENMDVPLQPNSLNEEDREGEDVELTVEETVEEELVSNDHKGLDTSYDAKLDLPHYKTPPLNLLNEYDSDEINVDREELEENKNKIVETLHNYSIPIRKIKATIGPTVTLYEIVPEPGIRISKIKNLEDDIALSLAALGIRIIAPIPGKGTVGIEVPNKNPKIVSMKSILASEKFRNSKYELPFGLGKTISNESYVADLTKMPHILMAGATGQGKSVGLNAILTSLLYKKHPAELKFILVDPKKVELTLYSKIERHFLAKLPDSEEAIINDTRLVVKTLNSLTIEMDNRYELLKDAQVRNIKEYNQKFTNRKLNPLHGHRYLPYIVLVIDEFADLIMTAGKEIESPITRLAQLARAVGIHLIIATQRPSVNIITGSIKANFPARIAFRVISKVDSRTILDSSGADQLIGRGDMLLSTGSDLIRLQCAFVDTPEVEKVTDYIGSQRAYPQAFHLPEYLEDETSDQSDIDLEERDELFEDAARLIVQTQQGSTSLLQRKLKLGYNRAGRIIDQLEAAGIVGPFEGSKAREVKVANEMALEQYLKDLNNND